MEVFEEGRLELKMKTAKEYMEEAGETANASSAEVLGHSHQDEAGTGNSVPCLAKTTTTPSGSHR